MNSIIQKTGATLAIALFVVVGSMSVAQAVPVLIAEIQYAAGSTTVATGILGLDVDGTLWDVDLTGAFTRNEWAGMLDVTTLTVLPEENDMLEMLVRPR